MDALRHNPVAMLPRSLYERIRVDTIHVCNGHVAKVQITQTSGEMMELL
jgi:hypothetical protein